MTKLISYLKPYWVTAILAPLLICMETIFDLLQPTLLAQIIDTGIKTGNMNIVIHTSLIMMLFACLGMLGGFGCTTTACITSQYFGADLRSDVFKKIQTFSFTNLDKFKTSSLITRLTNDITQVQSIVLMTLRSMVRLPILILGGTIMAVMLNAKLSAILLITIPALSFSLYFIMKKGFPLFVTVQQKLDKVNSVIRENLIGVRVVKAYVREDFEKSRFSVSNINLMEVTVKASKVVALIMPVMMLIMNFTITAVVWFGGIQYHNSSMTIGGIIAFINYMTQILFSLMSVAMILMGLSRSQASADRIREILDTEVDIKDAPYADEFQITDGRIVFENVSFKYKNSIEKPVLNNISFTAENGKTIAILGVTGSGKSTLVNLIPRLYDITKGSITIDNKDIHSYKLDTLRQSIGIVLQEAILFSGTIRENILWGNKNASDEELIEAAKAAEAHDFIMSFAKGYDTLLGQGGVNLSGGQKQRLSIARTLLKKPRILILDDSTSAVDFVTENNIQKSIKDRAKAFTCIIIAQRINSILDADKIIILEDGFIVAQGTHNELLNNSMIYRDIYNSQIGEEEAIYG